MSSFSSSQKSLRWGVKALDELESVIGHFFSLNPYARRAYVDPKTQEQVIEYVRTIDFPLDEIERRFNESMLCFRNAFDQAAFAACAAIDKTIRPNDTIYFPWADSESGCEKRLRGKSCKIPEKLWPTFLGLKPYGTLDSGTTDEYVSRELAKVANRKHSTGFAVGGDIARALGPGKFVITDPAGVTWAPPKDRTWDPMKEQIEILRYPPGMEFHGQETVYFNVVFDRSTSLKGTPIVPALRSFSAKAEHSIETLMTEIARITRG